MTDAQDIDIGATPEELASAPGLLTDLSLSLLPRRLGLAQGLLTLLGGFSRDKVRTLLAEVKRCEGELKQSQMYGDLTTTFEAARDLMAAVANLERAVFTLVIARAKHRASLVSYEMLTA